jgi:hypothetical protein
MTCFTARLFELLASVLQALLELAEVALEALEALVRRFMGELGRGKHSMQRATSNSEYVVHQLTGQVLLALSYRTSPWFALRAGVGYRAIGMVGGAVFVLGGTL